MTRKDKAWNILSSDEQTAITLSLSHGKSSWEVGEIMGKSHYKYLEIAARSKRFFKLFSEYFTEHEDLFPDGLRVDDEFQSFIENAIIKRLPFKTIINLAEDKRYKIFKKRNQVMEEQMALVKSQSKGKDLYDLILEFDRWNNFRILPPSLQEPSAFKRRNKTRDKNRLKLISSLPRLTIHLLMKKYEYNGNLVKVWLPIIDKEEAKGYHIIPVKKHTTQISALTFLGLPLFEDKKVADEYINLVYEFTQSTSVSCKKGLYFWPQFRVLSAKAINFLKIENIKVNRKYFEKEVGMDDVKWVRKMKKKSTINIKGEKTVEEEVFWDK
jgi:hypothetical protein